MDGIALLKADHKTAESLFKQFEKLEKNNGPAADKKKVVGRIIRELSVHAAVEEEVFYPGVRDADEELGDTVLEGLEEHHIVKWTLHELEGMKPSDERYDAKVKVLIESVRHHVKEEEGELFPQVRKAVGRAGLLEMGEKMEKLKKRAPKRPHPRSPDAPPANRVANRAAAALDSAKEAASPGKRSGTGRRTADTPGAATPGRRRSPTPGARRRLRAKSS